jgi:hypothetical protein
MRATQRHRFIYCLAILSMILGACGGAEEPTLEPTPSPTQEPTPTAVPVPGRLAINEVMPAAGQDSFAWVELINMGELPVNTAGVVLTDMDDMSYAIPEGSPSIQPGDLVLVQFDNQGNGVDDYDVSDGLVLLHTPEGITATFDPTGDQIGLFSSELFVPDTIIDFVAWGKPPIESDNPAVAAGIWLDGSYVNAERGGLLTGFSQPGESIGLFPGQPDGIPDSWVVYAAPEVTPGESNSVPTPDVLLPGAAAISFREDFFLGWYSVPHATSYNLQIDDSPEFDSPEVSVSLQSTLYEPEDPPAEGLYYWRIQAVDAAGNPGIFSEASEITVVDLPLPESPTEVLNHNESNFYTVNRESWSPLAGTTLIGLSRNAISTLNELGFPTDSAQQSGSPISGTWQSNHLAGLPLLIQRKDSDMICWDGDDETGVRQPWDGPHQDTPGNIALHGRGNCARASIAMVNHFYNGDLTQDRLSYQLFGMFTPYYDLGHNRGTTGAQITTLLEWAVQTGIIPITTKPTYAQIQRWINQNIAVVVGIPGHAMALRGYLVTSTDHPGLPAGTQLVSYNEPTFQRTIWHRYSTTPLNAVWVPTGTPVGRLLEESLYQDPDEDGINTFDEVFRFRTSPTNADTDFDCIQDQEDMVGILYEPVNFYLPVPADIDSDGKPKYRDPDNDNGGVIDGDEDMNFNGHLEDGETVNFDRTDDERASRICTKPYTVFVDNMSYGIRHDTGFSFILTGLYIFGNDPEPMPNTTVTIQMDGMGASEQIQVTTDENGWAEGEFKIFSYGTYTLTVEDVEGENMVYAPSMNQVSSLTVNVGPSEVVLPTTNEETIESFAAKLSEAFRTSNWGFAMERLHPAVIELYGAPLCAAYLNDQADSSFNLSITASVGPEAWDFERDERVVPLENVYEVQAFRTAHDQTTAATLHFIQAEDGTFRWLTDCGTPSP